jgi:hypothetical protein
MRFVNCMRAYSSRVIRAEYAPQVRQPVEMAAIFSNRLLDALNFEGEEVMQKRKLGNLEVSALGLGCMGMSANYGPPESCAGSWHSWDCDRTAGFEA